VEFTFQNGFVELQNLFSKMLHVMNFYYLTKSEFFPL